MVILALLSALPALAGSFTYDDLLKVLNDPKRQIRSIDALLSQPELGPAFRRGFTAMFDSRSLQGATPLNPRVILYGEDAKLVMAFTCAPGDCRDEGTGEPAKDLNNANQLEVIRWKDETKSFEFRRIDFPENDSHAKLVISEPNPKKCMSCHMGPDPRPNWESYFTWPGAYGGNDDQLAGDLAPGETMANLQRFLASGPTRPRYHALEDLADGYRNIGARDINEHNINLTRSLLTLNMDRMVSRIAKTPFYADLKFALAETANGGPTFTAQLQSAGLHDVADLVLACVRPHYAPGHEPEFPSHASETARLFYALGEPALPWLLSFEPTLKDEIVSPADVDSDLWRSLRAHDPELEHPAPAGAIESGWKRIAAHPGFSDGLRKCVNDADRKPPHAE